MLPRAFCLRGARLYCQSAVKSTGELIDEKLDDKFWKQLKHPTKVPQNPVTSIFFENSEKEPVEISEETIQLLERLSLVNLDRKQGLKTLKDSISFANRIASLDTSNIEPLYTVLEKENLSLREDIVADGNCRDAILKNAQLTEEDYFVAPPGNIPLEQDQQNTEKPQNEDC